MKHGKFEISKEYKPLYKKETQDIQVEQTNQETPVKKENDSSPAKNLLSYLHDFVALLSAVLLVLLLLLRIVVVSGESMKNTLLDGDYIVLLSSVFYSKPEQGDIIVASKDSFKDGEPIIKRVIATEGQVVDIDYDAGLVYVDGEVLDESYLGSPTTIERNHIPFPVTVEEGCIFVMGDNRNNSADSRSPEIGQIDCREILGKAVFLLFPGKNEITGKREFGRIGVLS